MALTKIDIVNLAFNKLGSERLTLTDSELTANTLSQAKTANLHYDQTLNELIRMHSWNCCKKRNELSPYKLKITLPPTLGSASYIGTTTIPSGQSTQNTFTNYAQYDFNGGYTASVADSTSGGTIYRYSPSTVYVDNDVWRLSWYDGSSSYVVDISSLLFDPSNTYTHHLVGNFVAEKVKPSFGFDYQFLCLPDAIRSLYLTNTNSTNYFLRPSVDWDKEENIILSNHKRVFLCYDGVPTPTNMDSLFAQSFISLLAARMAIPITGDAGIGNSILSELYTVTLPEAKRVNGFEQKQSPVVDSDWMEATFTSNTGYTYDYTKEWY